MAAWVPPANCGAARWAPQPPLLTGKLPLDDLERTNQFHKDLLASEKVRQIAFAEPQFVLFDGYGGTVEPSYVQPILELQPKPKWQCQPSSWYMVCER